MKLPWFKRLYENDFSPDDRKLVSKLSETINTNFENIYLAISNRLTFKDNFQCTIKDIDIEVSSAGTPITDTYIKLDKFGGTQTSSDSKAYGILILKVENLTNSTIYLTQAPFITWTQTQNGIKIDHITGLSAENIYRVTVAVFN